MGYKLVNGNLVYTPDYPAQNNNVSNYFKNLQSSYYDNYQVTQKPEFTPIPEGDPNYFGWQDSVNWGDTSGISDYQKEADAAFNAGSGLNYNRATDTLTGFPQNISLFKENVLNEPGAKKPGLFDNMNMGDWMSAGQAGAGALQNLYSIYQGEKMLDLAKDQFGFNRRLAKTNLFNQAQTVNAELSDRQRMRNSMGVGLSTEDYMKKYGVRGKM